MAILKQDLKKLKTDFGDLKGKFMELQVRDKIGAFLGHILKKARSIDFSYLADMLY